MKKLLQETEDGALVWSEGDYESFVCDHKNSTLIIRRNFDEERDRDYVVFRFISGEKNTPFSVSDADADYQQMVRIYDAVVANANDVSADLDNFFD
ncbi:hypothetical protein IAE41_01910 [Stenotrophomonas sp. S39]|nr:hypothetical protein [Stenotrophomonas sp. S39]